MQPMNILILGGTRFLGRHLVNAALARDHAVTLFNRGNYPAPTGVETIYGDRRSDLGKLRGRRWDAVVDTCGLIPRQVRNSAEELSESISTYVFISSQSAYADVSDPGVDESAPLATLSDEQLAEADAIEASGETSAKSYGKLYNGLKALCEQAVEEVLPEKCLTIRPGLIVGPNDYSDRFTYWVARVANGGEVLAPAPSDRDVQFIDVRDLAEWLVKMVEAEATGVYNASGPPQQFTMESVLNEARIAGNSDASFTWVDEAFLLEHGVAAWSEMPLWLPLDAAPHLKGFMFINSNKAVDAGLTYRPLSTIVADTLSWYRAERRNSALEAGLDRERERALLRKWHAGSAGILGGTVTQ